MEPTSMNLFHTLDESTKVLKKELDIPYLEALIHSAENLIDNGTVYNEGDILSEAIVKELETLYKEVELKEFDPETIRQAMQIALLRGMKEDYIQPNHQMTPDSLGSLIAYLIEIIAEPQKDIHIADLTVGTANLLLTISHFLNQVPNREITLSGVDNDELMLSLASTNSAIQRTPINLIYQDALTNLLLQPADIMVADLPIGYYPMEETISNFKTRFTEKDEKSYSHYLLIEQAMKYLKEGGYGFFLLPSNIFNDEKVSVLVNYLHEVGYIQGIIQLPQEVFVNETSRKSVFIVQKRGKNIEPKEEVLMVNAPDFKDLDAMKLFLGEIKEWKKTEE
ncbi:class I SAM-dependent methyltransferase [Carnobacteriaceae bacterium 52-44]